MEEGTAGPFPTREKPSQKANKEKLPGWIHQAMWLLNPRMLCVGRDLKDHLVSTPYHEQRLLSLVKITPSLIQPGLEHFQGSRDSHSFSGQPLPEPSHPHREEFLSNIQSNPALCLAFWAASAHGQVMLSFLYNKHPQVLLLRAALNPLWT